MENKYLTLLAFYLIITLSSCANNGKESLKHFDPQSKVVDYKSKIKDIDIDPLVSGIATITTFKDYLILHDLKSSNEQVMNLYNKKDFSHVTDAVYKGEGPGEATVPGEISLDQFGSNVWVTDLGKMLIWKFPLDSILTNPKYRAQESIKLSMEKFIYRYEFTDANNALGKAISLGKDKSISYKIAKINVDKNEIKKHGYFPENIVGNESEFKIRVSNKKGLYYLAYCWKDLISICNLDGSLKFNVYGKQWGNSKKGTAYFSGIDLSENKMFALYQASYYKKLNDNQRPQVVLPKSVLVFDLEGNYIETLDIGYGIISFCVDKDNNRIIFYFEDRDKPFGYVDYK